MSCHSSDGAGTDSSEDIIVKEVSSSGNKKLLTITPALPPPQSLPCWTRSGAGGGGDLVRGAPSLRQDQHRTYPPPPLWTESHTRVKTLPFVVKRTWSVKIACIIQKYHSSKWVWYQNRDLNPINVKFLHWTGIGIGLSSVNKPLSLLFMVGWYYANQKLKIVAWCLSFERIGFERIVLKLLKDHWLDK